MPKRSTGEPPLQKGLACARCKARKVRCSGGPGPCSSCLRTARFRGHDISQVKCAYNGEGMCSEDILKPGREHSLEGRRPSLRAHQHEKAPSSRTNSDSSVFSLETTYSTYSSGVSTAPSSLYLSSAASSTSSLVYDSPASSTYNLPLTPNYSTFQPAQYSLPVLPDHHQHVQHTLPTNYTNPPSSGGGSLALRRSANSSLPMRIELPPTTYTPATSPLSQSAPLATPNDWGSRAPPPPCVQSHQQPQASNFISNAYPPQIDVPQYTYRAQDDFYLQPYPSPSILATENNSVGPIFALPTPQHYNPNFQPNWTSIPPASTCGPQFRGAVSLAPTPSLLAWDSPAWDQGQRKDYWMETPTY
ncbi:hypothetical protein T439DRAFT_321499 [Meredithblackwellia eburnea MCA 4105]